VCMFVCLCTRVFVYACVCVCVCPPVPAPLSMPGPVPVPVPVFVSVSVSAYASASVSVSVSVCSGDLVVTKGDQYDVREKNEGAEVCFISMIHVPRTNGSCFTNEYVRSRVRKSHVPCECVTSHT